MKSAKFNVYKYLDEMSKGWNHEIRSPYRGMRRLRNLYMRLMHTFAKTMHIYKKYNLKGMRFLADKYYFNARALYDRLNIWREMVETDLDITGSELDRKFPAPKWFR